MREAEDGPVARDSGRRKLIALGLVVAGLAAGLALKFPCTRHGWDGYQYRRYCYNDIQPLFHVRKFGSAVPYRDVDVEYPVVIGTSMWVIGKMSNGSDAVFFYLNAVVLSALALVSGALMARLGPRRFAFFALPILGLYAFMNWDLFALAPGLGAIEAFRRRRHGWAGALLGIAASAKVFPVLLLAGFLVVRWRKRERRAAARTSLSFAAVSLVLNLPWIVVAPGGWIRIFRFHARRFPEFETFYYWVFDIGKRLGHLFDPSSFAAVSRAVAVLVFVAASTALVARMRHRGSFVSIGLVVSLAFFLVSPIYSPQYALWIVPLVLLAEVSDRFVWQFLAADVAVFAVRFRYFQHIADATAGSWLARYEWVSAGRWLALLMIGIWVIRHAAAGSPNRETTAEPIGT